MSDQGTARLGRELVAAWNAHDVDRIAALHAADFEGIDVADTLPRHGPDGARGTAERYWRAFPDLRINLEDMIVDGNRLVLIWTAHGTHLGTIMHIPATQHALRIRGVSVLRVNGSQIWHATVHWDVAGMLRAIGLLPDL